ncbi:MAG: hypothetical protein IT373_27615 [Polyangiaceae bacterium]|nr:hypothetical protein [Polyangiaceae bacterium]
MSVRRAVVGSVGLVLAVVASGACGKASGDTATATQAATGTAAPAASDPAASSPGTSAAPGASGAVAESPKPLESGKPATLPPLAGLLSGGQPPAAGGGEALGIPECDELFAKVAKCAGPAAAMLDQQKVTLKQALAMGGDMVKGELAAACKQQMPQIDALCAAGGTPGAPSGMALGGPPTGGGGALPPTCEKLLSGLDCMAQKVPAEMQGEMRSAAQQARAQFHQLAGMGQGMLEQACQQALEGTKEQFAQVGCGVAGGTPGGNTLGGGTPVTPPTGGGSYALGAIRAIPDSCADASVIAANAPLSAGATYHWPWTRQAMLAHPQFKVVTTRPSGPGQVYFEVIETDNAEVLVARCADGGTCNRLAAMLKAVVRSSNPQPVCGALPVRGQTRPSFLVPPDDSGLPAPGDSIAHCARLAACTIAANPSVGGDPGMECQKAPAGFKTACAERATCPEVLACAGGGGGKQKCNPADPLCSD